MRARYLIVVDLFVVGMIALVEFGIFAVVLPAQKFYDDDFGRFVQYAYTEATFEGVETQVRNIWKQMSVAFAGKNYSRIFSTPWFWEQTYHNSLAAQDEFMRQLMDKIDSCQEVYQKLRSNNTEPIALVDWYHKAVLDLRAEMKRKGSLDWALRGAWFLTFAPAAYWLNGWLMPIAMILTIIAVFIAAYLIFYFLVLL